MENKKFTAKEIDEEIEKTVQVLDDFPEMLFELFDRMEAKFPGSQLAQLKAFSRLHDEQLEGVNNPIVAQLSRQKTGKDLMNLIFSDCFAMPHASTG